MVSAHFHSRQHQHHHQQQHQQQPQQHQPKRLLKLLNYLGIINILGIMTIIVSEQSMSTMTGVTTRNTHSFPLAASYTSSLADSSCGSDHKSKLQQQNNNKHKGINETILRLEYLGVVVEVDYPRLPPWWWIENQYGDHPKILGLDQCQAFQNLNRHHVDDIVIAPAGLFDTGTNLLQRLLEMNCEFPYRDTNRHYHGRAFQPPWGKHTPREFRDSHRIPKPLYQNMILDAVLPVVLIRHPYDWFKSVCNQPYAIHWKENTVGRDDFMCPAIVHRDNETQTICVKYGSGEIEYETIAHLWNRWNRAWFDTMAFPRLMIRMEDLIFYPHRVIPKVCNCAGGTMMTRTATTAHFQVPLESTKINTTGHKQNLATTFLQAVIKYGNLRTWERFPLWDHMAARRILDKELLDIFGYGHPDMTIVQRNKQQKGIP